MEELSELKRRLAEERPAAWEELPDLALYMDQLISYMPRQLIRFEDGEQLTSAMVNNYSKDGLLPRAVGKRYEREHLAGLTEICALKKVLSLREMDLLLNANRRDETEDSSRLYADFRAALNTALTAAADRLPDEVAEEELPALALELALRSYADQLACVRILELLRHQTEPVEKTRGKRLKSDNREK